MANGQQLSERNFAAFCAWVVRQSDESFRLIANRGLLSRKEVAAQCGFSKSALHQNPRIKAALLAIETTLCARDVLSPAPSQCRGGGETWSRDRWVEQPAEENMQIRHLEQENARLQTENDELKRQLDRFTMIRDELALTGRYLR